MVKGEGVDIALALDISGSMSSLDFEPKNRLEAAKTVIADFVEERQYDRLGLVVFASESFIQSPPTIDHAFFKTLLDEVKLATDLRIDDGTAIGHGLASAANMLKDSEADSKVIILLTDGANNTGFIDPGTAALAVKALDIKVYTIGAGRPGLVPVPQRTRFGTRIVRQQSDLGRGDADGRSPRRRVALILPRRGLEGPEADVRGDQRAREVADRGPAVHQVHGAGGVAPGARSRADAAGAARPQHHIPADTVA